MRDCARRSSRHGSDVLILSAGWDAHRDDPLSKLAVSTDAYARIGELYGKLGLPTLIVQEGGYSLEAVAAASHAFMRAFRGAHVAEHCHPGGSVAERRGPGATHPSMGPGYSAGAKFRDDNRQFNLRSVMWRGSGFSSPFSTRVTMSVRAALARQGWPIFSPSRTT